MKLIELSKKGKHKGKFFVKVDDADYEWLNQWSWYAQKNEGGNYYARRLDGYTKFMHRELMGCTKGDGKLVDHADRDTFNNQRHNLRIATPKQNSTNRKSKKNGTSKYLGVSLNFDKRGKGYSCWIAHICVDLKQIHLGRFKNEIDAAKCYNEAAQKHHGEFASLNIIPPLSIQE